VFVPYVVSFDVQVKSADDVQLTYSLQIPNPDPVDLSVVIPAEERIQTGMIIGEMVNTTRTGFVRLNGRTIGNPASLATERANTDTSALFQYLWNNLSNAIAPVSTGRGASASADFSANKNIGLPDWRGTSPIGLDDMGNSAASAFVGLTFNSGSAILAGSSIGANSVVLSSTQMPAHAHTGTTSTDGAHTHSVSGSTSAELQLITVAVSGTTAGSFASGYNLDHTHTVPDSFFSGANSTSAGGNPPGGSNQVTTQTTSASSGGNLDHAHVFNGTGSITANHTHNIFGTAASNGAHSHTFTTSTQGGTAAINNIPTSRLVTWYIKL
jgi:hypothetical protein